MVQFLLIPAARLNRAIVVRSIIASGVAGVAIVGWSTHSLSGGVDSFMSALLLGMSCAMALKWKRERGMWMAYAFFGAVGVAGWVYLTFGNLGPSPQATKARIGRNVEDSVFAAWLFVLNARLLLSAAVQNFRVFNGGVEAARKPTWRERAGVKESGPGS
jgi:hypothetical protein